MGNKIILTISMLVSNRPDTVEKCLKSLENLRNKVSSELILVDTGCGEPVRSIIDIYTDNIVDFEWCNDFSKARNVGLKKASGEWFLYLDDDEWFEDTSEIEEFFTSGEYKKYSMASYKQRNYENLNGTVYSDAIVRRMTRIEPYTQFNYSIHEVLTCIPGNVKTFDCYVHHYGYIYKSKQDHYKHSQRNLIPLLQELEKEPYNLHHHLQIAQEYNGINEWYKSIEISLKGIENYNPKNTAYLYVSALMINVVECYFRLFQYENALKYAEEFWKYKQMTKSGKAKLCYLFSKIHYELGNYEKILPYVQIYEEMYEIQLKNPDIYTTQKTIFLYEIFDERIVASTFCIGVQTAIKLKQKEEAYHFFSFLDFQKNVLMIEQQLLEIVCQEFLEARGSAYADMLNKLLNRVELVPYVLNYLNKQRKKDKDILLKVGHYWEQIEQDHWYFDYLKLLTSESASRRKELFEKIWKDPNAILAGSMEFNLWDMAQEDQIDMYKIIISIPYYKWNQASLDVCNQMHWISLENLNAKISSSNREKNTYPHFLFWDVCFTERKIKEIENQKEINVHTLFQHYTEQIEKFYKVFYKDEVMTQNSEFMPANFQVAVCIKQVQEYMDLSDYRSAIAKLKTIRELCPDFSQAVKKYLQIVDEIIKQKEKEENEAKNEMVVLATALKSKIKLLIDQNNSTQALQIIQQLENFIGKDEELELLKERILIN